MKALLNQVQVVVEKWQENLPSYFSTFTDGSDNDRNHNKLQF